MNIAIVKYNAGNIHSVINALGRLGVKALLTDSEEELRKADKVIFPGVGEASTTMEYLRAHNLDRIIKDLKQPVLGICLGQQLMCSRSEEGNAECLGIFDVPVLKFNPQRHEDKVPHMEEGNAECLGIFDVPVLKFNPQRHEDKVPHMGWNTIETDGKGLFKGFDKPEYVYFVHSFYVPVCDWTAARTDYILPFSASLHKGNFYATQFHPEKSGSTGERILKNFLDM